MTIDDDSRRSSDRYRTRGGVLVRRELEETRGEAAIEALIDALDERRGALFASNYEYPGRYTRWDMGFVDPPIELVARASRFRVTSHNERGRMLLPRIAAELESVAAVEQLEIGEAVLEGSVAEPGARFPEEERSKQPSIFSVIRALHELFASPEDPHLGLYGAFAYDLAFQFEPVRLRLARPEDQRDLVLYLPDELIIVDFSSSQFMTLLPTAFL